MFPQIKKYYDWLSRLESWQLRNMYRSLYGEFTSHTTGSPSKCGMIHLILYSLRERGIC